MDYSGDTDEPSSTTNTEDDRHPASRAFSLPRLFMSSMFVTEPAILLVLYATGLLLLVLRCRVVTSLAVRTF